MTPSIRPDGGGRFCILKNRSVVDLREAFQLGRAVGAADGLDGDLALAVGADLGGRLCGSLVLGFLLAEQGVEGLQDQEQHECHDEEVAGTQEVSFGFAQT